MNENYRADPDFATTSPDGSLGVDRPTRVRYQVLGAACSLAVITYIHRVGFATASAEFKKSLALRSKIQRAGWFN